MASTEGLIWRPLVGDDAAAGVKLAAEAGWNQTADDWRLMLSRGLGLGVAPDAGAPVATAMVLPYGDRFAWIAMVLVTAAWRRRGLATELLRRCIAKTGQMGLIAGLDATAAGREVYRPLGFNDIYGLTRWQADPARVAAPMGGVRPVQDGDLDRIAAYDATVFGADRRWLLADFRRRRPAHAFVAERDGAVRGFVLARDGRQAHHLSPLVADDGATARALAAAALADLDGPVLIDALDPQPDFVAWLGDSGFSRQRGYTRMLLGHAGPLDDPNRLYAVGGPEFG